MNFFNIISRVLIAILALPVSYVFLAVCLSLMTINGSVYENQLQNKTYTSTIYLSTNGLHVDMIIPKKQLSKQVTKDLVTSADDTYMGFGWGDENFYLYTPTLQDLKASTAVNALFLKSSTLMHVKQFQKQQSDWVAVKVTQEQLKRLNTHIAHSFEPNAQGNKQLLAGKGYGAFDNFYKAKGSYSLFNTCNTWVNTGLKKSGLKASAWTPVDIGILHKYK